MIRPLCAAALCGLMALGMGQPSSSALDPGLPTYEPVQSVAGNLRTVGSDTMGNVVGLWAEGFKRAHPGVRIQIEAKGSSTGPPALMEGQAQFAPMSRAMDPEEVDEFVERFGYKPTELRSAIDCVAVFVHKDCPLDEITVEQLRDVFSVSGSDMTWGDLGVTDPAWADRAVSLYGRNSASGTYKFFKKAALGKTDFKKTVKEQPGSAGVVSAIASDPAGMGYSGIGFQTPGVKVLRVAFDEDSPAVEPGIEGALSGEYPLARFLYVYMNYDRRKALDPLRAEFARFIFSREGQEAVLKDGSFPLTAEIATEELEKLGLSPAG